MKKYMAVIQKGGLRKFTPCCRGVHENLPLKEGVYEKFPYVDEFRPIPPPKKHQLSPFPPLVGIGAVLIAEWPFEAIWNLWLEAPGASERVVWCPERDFRAAWGGQAQVRCRNGVLHFHT